MKKWDIWYCVIIIIIDIDECTLGNHACNHDCVNTNGSYYCSCYKGYQPSNNLKFCVGQYNN